MAANYQYEELEIWIEPEPGSPGSFRSRIDHSVGGSGREPFEPPPGPRVPPSAPHDATRGERHLRALPSQRPADPRETGRCLFEALFRGTIKDILVHALASRSSRDGLRIRLCFDTSRPEVRPLAALPWELLFDPRQGQFLARDRRTPVVRSLATPRGVRPLAVEPPLRILVAVASPHGYPALDTETEGSRLRRALERSDAEIRVELLAHARLEDLRRLIGRERFHVLHFIGHGERDPDGEGTILLEREDGGPDPVSGRRLAEALDTELRLAVLNACETGRATTAAAGDPWSGVSEALTRRSVPAVVAMQRPIGDAAAIRFASSFYRSLAEGDPVDRAVSQARWDLGEHDREGDSWAVPVLHLGSRDGRLFDLDAGSVRVRARRWLRRGRASARRRPLAAASLLFAAVLVALLPWGLRAFLGHPLLPPLVAALHSDPGCPPPPGLGQVMRRIRSGDGALDVCLGATELTQRDWKVVVDDNPSEPRGRRLPVNRVTYDEVDRFLSRLDERDRGPAWRLPTGNEWRAGVACGEPDPERAYFFGDDPALLPEYGNCLSEGASDGWERRPAPVGSFPPNPCGLHDVHGNVQEWSSDAVTPEAEPGEEDPDLRPRHLAWGGSYDHRPESCTSNPPKPLLPGEANPKVGLRLARDPVDESGATGLRRLALLLHSSSDIPSDPASTASPPRSDKLPTDP